ncbi:NemA NADH flavin oxidoreductase [Pyrenophora tritici-repentis]|nr:NemA NADH flavin oxidoreductase [Pyrenophora tritici-repentis]
MSKLFQPLKVGSTDVGHRIAMAPLTRYRMNDDYTANAMSKEYYEQRASVPGTLIISEATIPSPSAIGCRNAPGIWSPSQIAAWKPITSSIHARGCYIYCQLWHQGRAANPSVLAEDGITMVSSSAVPMTPSDATPTALSEEEIWSTIADYASAAKNAIEAGFDGVEIHGANGYLPDQFLQTTCNQRTDAWGGSIENRCRFHLEVTKAVIAAVGADKVAMRLSPYSDFNGMLMPEPEPTFSHLLSLLKPLNLAFLHIIEARITGNDDSDCGGQKTVRWMVEEWGNSTPVMLAGGFKPETARKTVDEPKYWCKFCSTFVKDTKFERAQHEATGRHQGNIQRSLKGLHREQENEKRNQARAQAEVARLNGLVPSASTPSVATGVGGKPTFEKRVEKKATVDDRKRQWDELAAMGVALPAAARGDLAMAGEWKTVSEQVIGEVTEDGEFKVTALNKGKKGWGHSYKSFPGSKGGDDDIESLLGKTKTEVKKEESKDEVKVEATKDEDADVKTLQEIPTVEEAEARASEAAAQKEEDAPAAPAVVFKKRKKAK